MSSYAIPQIPDWVNLDSLKDLLKWLGIVGAAGKGAEFIREKIRRLHDRQKFGFSPKKDLSIALSNVESTGLYDQLVNCVGTDYEYLNFLTIGLYIHDLGKEGKKQQIREIKDKVHRRHKKRGIRILSIASTGVLPSIVKYLTSLKMEDYEREELQDELNYVIEEFDHMSIFVKNEDDKSLVQDKIIGKMTRGLDVFFLFGIGGEGKAGLTAAKAVATLNNRGTIKKHGYSSPPEVTRDDLPDNTPMFAWTFQKK